MFPQIEIKHNIGNTIRIPNQLDVRVATYTSVNALPAATAISVDNAADFTLGSTILLLLASMGNENAEIVTSTTHTNTGFTVSALTQQHSRGEAVQEIKWDKIALYKSATIDGSYVQVGSDVPFMVTQANTVIFDAPGLITDYYKVQWKNSVTNDVSGFSSPISVLAYSPKSAGAMFASVMSAMGVSENDPKITPTFLLSALNDGRQYCESELYGIRHDWRQVFEYPIKVLAGSNYVLLPDQVDFEDSDRSVLAARFLTNNILVPYNMRYIDKRTWNQVAYYSTGGLTDEDVSIGATSIKLNSVGDFAQGGGQAQVATTDYDQLVISINYTSIDYQTNELLGVTGVTRAIPSGTQVWSRASMNQPVYYTVYSGKIWFSSVIPNMMQGNNLYIDFYEKMVKIDNYYDIIPEHYREMYKSYLRWAIKYRKDNTTPTDDPDLVKWEGLVKALFNNLYTGQEQTIITS